MQDRSEIEGIIESDGEEIFFGRNGTTLYEVFAKDGKITGQNMFQARYQPPTNPQEASDFLNTSKHDITVQQIQQGLYD